MEENTTRYTKSEIHGVTFTQKHMKKHTWKNKRENMQEDTN